MTLQIWAMEPKMAASFLHALQLHICDFTNYLKPQLRIWFEGFPDGSHNGNHITNFLSMKEHAGILSIRLRSSQVLALHLW